MNNKGFTLIELIATIALLAIIAVISFVSINTVVNNSRVSNCESLVTNIKGAAREYVSDNRYNLTSNNDLSIEASILTSGNYLTAPIINPFNNEEISADDIKVTIKLKNDYSAGEINVFNKNGNKINCESGVW